MNTPYKGQIDWLPDFIGEELMNQQELQGYKRDISVFEKNIRSNCIFRGFDWDRTKQGAYFWEIVLIEKDINLFLAWFKPELEVFDQESKIFINRVVGYNKYLSYPFFVKNKTTNGFVFQHARLPKKRERREIRIT